MPLRYRKSNILVIDAISEANKIIRTELVIYKNKGFWRRIFESQKIDKKKYDSLLDLIYDTVPSNTIGIRFGIYQPKDYKYILSFPLKARK